MRKYVVTATIVQYVTSEIVATDTSEAIKMRDALTVDDFIPSAAPTLHLDGMYIIGDCQDENGDEPAKH